MDPHDVGVAAALDHWGQRVSEAPTAPVLQHELGWVSRAELATAVDAAARDFGAMRGDAPVGVVATRCADLAVAMLGAWRAHRRIAVLDVLMPHAYLRQCLARCGAEQVFVADGWRTLRRAAFDHAEPVDVPAVAAEVSHFLATSGSTGIPKMIGVSGTELVSALFDYTERLRLTAADRFVFLAGAGHDSMFRDLLLPLLVGARTHVPGAWMTADARRLVGYLATVRPTVVHLTPARADVLATAADAAGVKLPDTRAVVCCGAALTWGTVERLRAVFPQAEIFNGYGVTEVPQLASLRPVDVDSAMVRDRHGVVPVGAGFGRYTLDVDPAPEGEIRIVTPTRTLHTGDRGRIAGGEVEWLGRLDRQVSVAGYRVEPAEIERELMRDPSVADAAVTTAPDSGETGPLCAYVVASGQLKPDIAALKSRLRGQLPEWMVPSRVHLVPAIALDRNGKPDAVATARLAGPARDGRVPDSVTASVLSAVRDVLPEDSVIRADENFFDAGLDSFGLLRLAEILRHRGHPDVELTDLFRWPNIKRLAEGLRSRA